MPPPFAYRYVMPNHWRAAAWLLERRNPDDFTIRQPHLVTEQQLADTIHHLVEVINHDLPEENYHRAIQKLDDIMLEMRKLHEPIGVVPINDNADEESLSQSSCQSLIPNHQSLSSDSLAQLTDATDPLEVEIDLRIEAQDIS